MSEDFADHLSAVARIDAVPRILEVVNRVTGMRFSAVARVTEKRWIACAVRDEIEFGLVPGGELKIETTICDAIRQNNQPVVIDHVAEHADYCAHPTPRMYGFQSYASFPIRLRDGRFFGTLCAIDPRPAQLDKPEIRGMFELFADLIAMHLDSQDRVAISETALLHAREAAQLREQFIAVLGHDLRNPLSAVLSCVDVLSMTPRNEDDAEMLTLIRASSHRMAGLISDLLDFARGRLGSGLEMERKADGKLAAALQHVVDELQTTWPARKIQSEMQIDQPVRCDSARIAQMLSNLIANALTHGDPAGAICIRARTAENRFDMSVTNPGTIPPAIRDRLFEPFTRGTVTPGRSGLGLGLYIATEIARAHGGALAVESSDGMTRFTFSMPA